MTKRQMREYTFKELFQKEFYAGEEYSEQLRLFLEEQEDLDAEMRAMLAGRAEEIAALIPELDEKINAAAIGWTTSRMAKVDVTILRLAVYEIFYDEEIPEKVAINEAVELAKIYGGEDSYSFINGILGNLVKKQPPEPKE